MNGFGLGELFARVGLDTSGFDAGVNRVNRGFSEMERRARNSASNMNSLGGAFGKMGASVVVLSQGMQLVQQAAAMLERTVIALGESFLEAQKNADSYRIRLESLLGSVKKGQQVFKDMQVWASKTPFTFSDTMNSAASIAGIMPDPEEIKRWMNVIGDLAAATGLSIQETTGQVQRMLSAGATSADLFRERGVLAMLGFTAKTAYSAEETKKILWKSWEDSDSKYRGVMEKLAMTTEGQLSNMQDRWDMFKMNVMTANGGIGDSVVAMLQVLGKSLDDHEKEVNDYANSFSHMVVNVIEDTVTLGARCADEIKRIVLDLKYWLGPIADLVGRLVDDADKLAKLLPGPRNVMNNFWGNANAIFAQAGEAIKQSKITQEEYLEAAKKGGSFDVAQLLVSRGVIKTDPGILKRLGLDADPLVGFGTETYEGRATKYFDDVRKQMEANAKKQSEWAKIERNVTGPKPGGDTKANQAAAREMKQYEDALDGVNKALRDAQTNIAAVGLDELGKDLLNVDNKAADLKDRYKELIAKHPDLEQAVDRLAAAERKAAEDSYLNKHFQDLAEAVKGLENDYLATADRVAGGDLYASVMAEFRKIDSEYAKFLANAEKLGEGDQARADIASLKGKSGRNAVTQVIGQMLEQLEDGQRELSSQARLNDITGAVGGGFFDGNEREAQQAAQSIRDSFEKPIAALEKLIGVVPEAKGMLAEFKAEMENMANANYELVKEAPIQAAKQRIQGLLDVTQNISDAIGAMQQPLQEFLTTFAQTGEMDFGQLVEGLTKQLQIMAAAKTSEFLMTAAFEGIMALIDSARSGEHSKNAVLALQGAAMMGTFVMGSGLAGMAHSGIDSIPEDGTWLLKKNERVVDPKTNQDLKQYMKNGKPNVSMNVTINGGDEDGIMNALPKLRDMILDTVTNDISSGGRTGTVIKTYTR